MENVILIIISVISMILAIMSFVQAMKSSKQSNENAKKIAQIAIQQIHSQVYDDFCTRYQDISVHLHDKNKREYQEAYLDLFKDVFFANKQGKLPKEEWTIFIERMCFDVKQDPSYMTVWKNHAQVYEQDFVSFFDNEILRKVGLI